MSSTDEERDKRKANTSTNQKKLHEMLMLNEESTHIWIIYGKTMTLVKFCVFIRTHAAIKPVLWHIYPPPLLDQYPIFTLPRIWVYLFMAH